MFAVLTHAMIGYTIVSAMREPAPIAGVVGAILPDVDLLFAPAWSFPLVHRGVTHTPLCGAVIVVCVGIWQYSRSSPRLSSLYLFSPLPKAVTLGYGSHLIVDSFTASGVPWLYPITAVGYGIDAGIHGVEASLILWLACTFHVVRQRTRRSRTTQ